MWGLTKQTIDTEKVASAIDRLRSANNKINEDFQTLQNTAKRLETDWTGEAGSLAHTTMYELFTFNEVRSTILENYTGILEQQVNPGYENAENANLKLADKFR